ncbi:MAG: ABC transporter permease [Euryarchaeota archaeon]|nr:ABC transporter permease [Euryarchaeota archaeon]
MQKLTLKHDRLLILFLLLGLVILAFVLAPLLNLTASQLISNQSGMIDAISDSAVWRSIILTMYTALVATGIAFIFGVPLAYFLARRNFIGKGIIESIVDIPIIIPHTVAGIALLTVFGAHGLIGDPLSSIVRFRDAFSGIVVAMLFVSLPFLINSAREGFQSVDPRLENVARSLGASAWGAFLHITVPLAARHILVGSIMCWARAMSEFGAVIVIAYYPMIAPTLIYERYISYGLSESSPIAVLLIVICFVLFIVLRMISAGWRQYDRD